MAYDELSRIERLYGSVAEYNRVQDEEQPEDPELKAYRDFEKESECYGCKRKSCEGCPKV